jgi:hypothetical protein
MLNNRQKQKKRKYTKTYDTVIINLLNLKILFKIYIFAYTPL